MRAPIRPIASSCGDRRGLRAALAGGLAAAVLLTGVAAADPGDDAIRAAYDAFRARDAKRLAIAARGTGGHVLAPYVDYWLLRLRLNDASPVEVRAMLDRLADGPLAERLRIDWLKLVGRREEWSLFDADFREIQRPDTELACLVLQRRRHALEAEERARARALWFAPRESPSACNPVFDALRAQGAISDADVWSRIRLALEAGQVTFAKRLGASLPPNAGFNARNFDAAAANPRAWLDRKHHDTGSRGAREVVLFAVHRLARSSVQQAAERWRNLAPNYTAEERGYVWGLLAFRAALRHEPEALEWYGRAGSLTDDQLAWKARAALRAGQWPELLAAIDAMDTGERNEPEWRYWRARALQQAGRTTEANAVLAPLSNEHHFYGLLAGEALGAAVGAPMQTWRASDDDVEAIGRLPGIVRALALLRIGLRWEGVREWNRALDPLDDRQLLAAAELARRHELWDRAINTAERTREVHDFALRYLAPYRELFASYARENGLDEAWVFGVARQESRFIADARSHAGAQGLMQLMPATARWVAGKMGMKSFRQSAVRELDVNISLGTYYLRYVLDYLDNQPVLASAGYNAGPGRARSWQGEEDLEAAVYAETIPFNETRDYVKKVMANATYYAQLLGDGAMSLGQRIGMVPGRPRDR